MSQLFISFTEADKDFASRLATDLRKFEYDVYFSPDDARSGPIIEQVSDELSNYDCFLLIFSPEALQSRWVKLEFNAAVKRLIAEGKTIIPLIYKRCDIPTIINSLKQVDFAKDTYQTKFRELIRMLNQEKVGKDNNKLPMNNHLENSYEHIKFVNQEVVIRDILSTQSNPITLIEAPSGGGKTHLLNWLQYIFEVPENHHGEYIETRNMKSHQCSYVFLNGGGARDLVKQVFDQFGSDMYRSGQSLTDLGRQFARSITDLDENKEFEGFVLLIDLSSTPSESFVRDFLGNFIPQVWSRLNTLTSFKENPHKLRIVLAGCNLSDNLSHLSYEQRNMFYQKIHKLAPFEYEHLNLTVKKHLVNRDKKTLNEISRHIYHYSGGHIRCIVRLLQLYNETKLSFPDEFIREERQTIMRLISIERDSLIQNWPKNLETFTDYISGFRVVNISVIEYLIDQLLKKNERSSDLIRLSHEERDRLSEIRKKQSYADLVNLMTRLNILLRSKEDGIYFLINHHHRVLGVHRRTDTDFQNLVKEAFLQYLNHEKRQPYRAERWAIEYLYHALLALNLEIGGEENEKAHADDFFEQTVPFILGTISASRRPAEVHDLLTLRLKKDDDFQFTINYYLPTLRDNVSSFDYLLSTIDAYFGFGPK